jgi:DNA-binding IclR family transcriptional regulator
MSRGHTATPEQKRRKPASRETPSIQSLDRGLVILEAVGKSREPVSLGQLTSVIGIDRSSVFRLANTMKRRGFLANSGTGKDYILGAAVWRLSRQYDWTKMLATIAHDHLKALAISTNETAHLAVREGKRALFVDHVAANHVISIAGQTGELVPLYCTSHGKALLADFDAPLLKTLFGTAALEAHTKQTIVSVKELAKACAEIKLRGYAMDDAEYMEGVRCVAAPIRDKDGAVIGSIGISAPMTRFPKERYQVCAREVLDAARQIGELIGAQAS